MTMSWMLNAIGLFAVTSGALLMFLSLRNTPKIVAEISNPEARRAYEKHRRLSIVAVGLIAAWLLIQYVGLLFT
jgi:3-dehydroquinate dehydratase